MRAECVVGAGGRYYYLEEHEGGNGAAPLPFRKLVHETSFRLVAASTLLPEKRRAHEGENSLARNDDRSWRVFQHQRVRTFYNTYHTQWLSFFGTLWPKSIDEVRSNGIMERSIADKADRQSIYLPCFIMISKRRVHRGH